MYRQPPFRTTVDEALDVVEASGPAHLVTTAGGALASSFVPMLLERGDGGALGSLVGHLARANRQWVAAAADPGAPALAIFTGADAYVSPSWYPSKRETGKAVPTWDYTVVHVHGRLVVHDDPAWVTDVVARLSDRHEQGRPEPWSIADAPAGYIEQMARAIVGVELRIERVEGARKLSQNRSADDVAGVIAGLDAGGPAERAVADDVRRAVALRGANTA